jgi:hypothetical protein
MLQSGEIIPHYQLFFTKLRIGGLVGRWEAVM